MPIAPRTAVLAALLPAALVLPGCLVTSNNSSSVTGNRVAPGADRRVVLRESTPDDAINELGEPSARVTDADGREVLTWTWSERRASSGSVFLIFGGSSETTHQRSLHIAFRDGLAERRWFD